MSSYMTASELSQAYQSVLKPANKPESEVSQVTSTDDKYEVKLSIHNFEPEELSVKVIDRYVHVEGRHEEKNDKIGFFTRQFTRRYFLPDGAQPESIRCTYCVDTSILTVTAPIVNKKPVKEIVIPIVIIGHQQIPPPLPKHRDRDANYHRGGGKEKDREGEREHSRDRGDRPKQQQQREHQHQHQHQHHLPHLLQQQQSSTSASVTATSSTISRKQNSAERKQKGQHHQHHHHHHNHHHHNEPQHDKYQHQMNF